MLRGVWKGSSLFAVQYTKNMMKCAFIEGEQPLCRIIYKKHDEICFHILYHLIYYKPFHWSVILRRGISEAKSDSLDVEC